MDYRTKLKRALEKAHMAAMKTGGQFTPEASRIVQAGVICRHFAGADFGKLLIYTKGPGGKVTGGVVYLPGVKISVPGNKKTQIKNEMAFRICSLEAYYVGKEAADGESV
jgi:hypothetical protein